MSDLWWLFPAVVVVAMTYSAVGHGGASGYLALLALVPGTLAPDEMATTALTLNVVVAGIGWVLFTRGGHFSLRLALPFIALSVPAAFLGGTLEVSVNLYAGLLAFALAFAALRMLVPITGTDDEFVKPPAIGVALPTGGAIGLLSGVVGVGGGIFLSPVILLARWASPKKVAACAAFFILVNSVAGLLGRLSEHKLDYGDIWPLLIAAIAGGFIGSYFGSRHIPNVWLNRLLAAVLLIAVVKLVTTVV